MNDENDDSPPPHEVTVSEDESQEDDLEDINQRIEEYVE
jgi:hypothetical protein